MHWIRLLFSGLLLSLLLGCVSIPTGTPQNTAIDLTRPSIEKTQVLDFASKQFELRVQAPQQAVPIFEYFLPGEAVSRWSELVDFRVYPVHPEGNQPLQHAQRLARQFKQQYPHMQFELQADEQTGVVLLDFFYPTSTRKDGDFLEFNAFKFFQDAGTPHVISFHYAKNIPDIAANRGSHQVGADIRATRAQVLPALVKLPLYRQ